MGTPPNLIGIGFLRREGIAELPFFSWMLLGVPVVAVLHAVMLLDLTASRGARASSLGGVRVRILAERRALAIGATMASSLGFVLPVSTPCNAIVYGSGRIPLPTMMRHGIVLDLVGVVTIIGVVALLGPIVLGR